MNTLWPQDWKEAVESALDQSVQKPVREGEWAVPNVLISAMRYALLGGGKRLRPLLALESARFCSDEFFSDEDFDLESAMPAAMAVEYIHAYSLVHDDLPSLDNDDFRRGKPTVHKKFGEAVAILCGDALLTDAFALLASGDNGGAMCAELSRAAGSVGMVGGQMQDLLSEGSSGDNALNEERLYSIHARKTARLISCACTLGALSVKSSEEKRLALAHFGRELGMAFQIADDILDDAGDFEKRGKVTGADAENDKLTFVSLYGLDGARERASKKLNDAVKALGDLGDVGRLSAIARFAIERDR